MPSTTRVAATGLLLLLVAQVARTMFPLMYLMGEDWNFLYVGLISLAVYAAPLVAVPLSGLGDRPALLVGAGAIVLARLAVQVIHPIPTWLAMGATAVALVGIALALVELTKEPRAFVVGVVLGLALDTAVRAPFRSWDLAWQGSVVAVVCTMVLVGLTLAAAVRVATIASAGARSARVAPLGAFLMLQLVFLQNVGYVGSQADVGFAAATFLVLAGDAVALTVLPLVLRGAAPRSVLAVAGTVAAALAWWLPLAEGALLAVLVLLLQPLLTGALAVALDAGEPSSPRRLALDAALASVSFLLLTLLWQIDITMPLPFPREAVPAAAVLLVVGPAIRRAALVPTRLGVAALVPAGVVAALAVVLGGWLWLDRPDTTTVSAGPQIRVVQYNVRGAVNVDGQVDPDAIARAIGSSDPDIVILQEVARGWPVFGAGDLLARLQQRLAMPFRYEPAADGQFGNAILSRLPMSPISSGLLPDVEGKQDRSYLAVRVETARGPLVVVGAHLEGDDAPQIEALLAAWGGTMPAVIAGDMNMEPRDVENVARFASAGLIDAEGATGDECRTTAAEPTSACDRPSWVFVSSDLDIVSFGIGTETGSDHLPVHVTVRV
ncbi:MAG: endonuclease/exonuclease/phosphatase family protein [Actinomycetota bacterium]